MSTITTVIGPIPIEDWYFMRELRDSLKFMNARNANGRFDQGIKTQQGWYKETLANYAKAA